ncbi:MAG: hypothetical protein WAW46_07420 [Polaromonas sp.]
MKLFSNTGARRNTALMVLLVWLFVLASGVANACLLEARETHSHIVGAGSFEAAQASAILPGHAGTVADHDDDSQNFKAPCLKACDDGSRSLPKQNLTVAQPDPGPAPLVMVLWSAVAPVVAALRQMDGVQPATPGLPVRVRYSRLAL